jgi:hypothetical protein
MQWRSGVLAAGRERDRVANCHCVIVAANEDVPDEELEDARLLVGVHVIEAVCEAAREALDGVGELEVVGGVVDLGFDRVLLGAQRRFAAP